MSLPLPWVDKIFEKLTLTYGRAFLQRWQDIDLDAVKVDWAHEMSGFERAPQSIAFALSHLPDAKPPTALEFRALCRMAPAADLPRLPEPAADPIRVAAELAKLAPVRQTVASSGPVDHKAWARRIVAKHAEGIHVNTYPLRCAREVLGLPTGNTHA